MIRLRIVWDDDTCHRWDMWREFSRSFSSLKCQGIFQIRKGSDTIAATSMLVFRRRFWMYPNSLRAVCEEAGT